MVVGSGSFDLSHFVLVLLSFFSLSFLSLFVVTQPSPSSFEVHKSTQGLESSIDGVQGPEGSFLNSPFSK